MVIYTNHERNKFGEGFGDVITGIVKAAQPIINTVKDNKDVIVEGAKAVGSIGSATSKIVDTIKNKNKKRDIELIRKKQNEKIERNKQTEVSQSVKDKISNTLSTNSSKPRKGGLIKYV